METYIPPLYTAPISHRPAIWYGLEEPSNEQLHDINDMGFCVRGIDEGIALAKSFAQIEDSNDKDREIVVLERLIKDWTAVAVFCPAPTVLFLSAVLKESQSGSYEGNKLQETEVYAHFKGNEWIQVCGHIE